jgi:hypothetical protein
MQISRRGFGALLAPLLVVTTSVAVVLDPAVDQSVAAASTSIVTGAHDDLRTGWYPDQPGLGPDDVASAQFGPLFDQGQIDGQVYAQPLVADGRVLIATETNFVYSLDPTTGAINWSRQLRAPYAIAADTAAPNNMDDCGDLTPNVGITGTPVVVDDTMYAYSKGYVSGPAVSDTNVGYWLHAIDITTGEERPSFPVQIPPGRTADNDPGTRCSSLATSSSVPPCSTRTVSCTPASVDIATRGRSAGG